MDVLNCGQLGLGNGNREGKVRRLHRARIMTVNHEVQEGPLWRRFRQATGSLHCVPLKFIAHRLRGFRHIIQEHVQYLNLELAEAKVGFIACAGEESMHKACISLNMHGQQPAKYLGSFGEDNIPKASEAFVPTLNHGRGGAGSLMIEVMEITVKFNDVVAYLQHQHQFQASRIASGL